MHPASLETCATARQAPAREARSGRDDFRDSLYSPDGPGTSTDVLQ